jgi:ribonuclease HII
MSWLLGIDEAGRGPVVGPLVLCGVFVEDVDYPRLKALGLRDSKAYGSSSKAKLQRAQLAAEISEFCTVSVHYAEAKEVDRWVAQGGLNELERDLARRVIADGPPTRAIIADGKRLFSSLSEEYPQLEAFNRADNDHPVVAAASIVAKSERDRRLKEIYQPYEEDFGPLGGGGYPNATTGRFLRAFAERCGRLPEEIRHSWSWPLLAEIASSLEEGGQ